MKRTVRVVPAILTDDPATLATLVSRTDGFTDYAQIDIMDGRFVPPQSITAADIGRLSFNFKWEAHLMVAQPEACLEGFKEAGARRIVFHYEATDNPGEVIVQIKGLGLEAGLAVNPETPASVITPLANELDGVLFLSVNPGYYGSEFIPGVLDKIAAFRRDYPDMEIAIDGGMKEDNIALTARSGVDVICVGSAIFRQPQPGESYRRLLALANE